MKGEKTTGKGLYSAQTWVTIRVTPEEKARLAAQADMAGLSVSEYLRRRFFGGRPLVAHTDALMVRELRRIGGLLKHNFETLRLAGASVNVLSQQEEALRKLSSAIDRIGVAYRDR